MTPELSVIAPEREGPPPPDPARAPAASSPGKPRRGPTAFASDDRLARRAGRGDADAFAAIFRRYERDLYRFCVGILGEPQDAHDAIQNTMVKVLKALPGERREIQLKPWLYRIAHNEAVELRRRRRQLEPLESGIADGAVSIEERAERSERLELLFRDMTDLPERQRAVLVMRELNGLEFGEIGAALGTSPSAVRQALYEARRCLQQMELGRHMDCDAVARVLSDEEGRLRGRRDVRAHLRQCPDCRRVRREVSRRKQALAAIPPLPAFSAAGIAKGAVAGSGAGGAGAAAGLAGGAAAGPGLVKSVAGVLAIVAVGTAAADRGGLADLPGGPRGTLVEREAGAAEPARRDASASGPSRGEAGGPRAAGVAPASALPRSSARAAASGAGDRSVRGGRATRIGPASSEPVGTPPSRGDPAAATAAPRQGATAPAAQPTVATPEGGSATGDRSTTARPARPARPEQPARPAQPAAEEKAERAPQPEPQGNGKAPEANARGRRPEPKGTGRASPPSVPTAPPAAASEPPARPQRAPHPEQSRQEPAAAPAEPTPAAVEPAPTAAPAAAPPGNGKGNANGAAAGKGPPGKEASALPE